MLRRLGVALPVLLAGCQGSRGAVELLSPDLIRASSLTPAERTTVLDRWAASVALANEFLAGEFNHTLPANARLQLTPAGMSVRVGAREIPIRLVVIDRTPGSSCVCATVDTHRDEVLVYRPWGIAADVPVLVHNTFFEPVVAPFRDSTADLAWSIVRLAAIFYFDTEADISTWEWFKCQYLEWLIGSGHHRASMRLPDTVSREFGSFIAEMRRH